MNSKPFRTILDESAAQIGFTQWGYVPISRLHYSTDVRKICEGNSCRNYGASWECPPAVSTLAECRRRVEQYPVKCIA